MAGESEHDRLNCLSNEIIGAALRVHTELGPGMLESAYEACLLFELNELGHKVERQKPLPSCTADTSWIAVTVS